MDIQRLQWAGVLIDGKETRILIDPVYKSPDFSFFGEPLQEFSPLDGLKNINAVFLTHLHSDHFDPEYIQENLASDVQIYVPHGTEKSALDSGLENVKGVSVGETVAVGGLFVTGVPALDGLGDIQISWVIKDGEKTAVHCGDTLWHGYWWQIAKDYGPINAALLPVNGAIVKEEDKIESGQPICLTPEQAVAAAKVLNAEVLIPIHYGSFHNPPVYLETENVEERIAASAEKNDIKMKILNHFEKASL